MSDPDEKPQGSSKSQSELSQQCTIEPDEKPQSLSESESELLLVFEEKFKYRYTDQDPKYMEFFVKPLPRSPIAHSWFSQNRRHYDRRDNSRGERSRGRDYNQMDRSRSRSGGDDSWHGRDGQWEDRRKGYQGYAGRRGYQDRGDGYGRDSTDNAYQQRPRRDY